MCNIRWMEYQLWHLHHHTHFIYITWACCDWPHVSGMFDDVSRQFHNCQHVLVELLDIFMVYLKRDSEGIILHNKHIFHACLKYEKVVRGTTVTLTFFLNTGMLSDHLSRSIPSVTRAEFIKRELFVLVYTSNSPPVQICFPVVNFSYRIVFNLH